MEDLLIIYVLLCFSNFFADRENASGNSWDIPILQQPCTLSSIRLPKTRHTNYSQKHCKCQQNRINTAFLDLKTTVFNRLQIPPKQKIRKPSMTCMKCKSDERSPSLILSHSGLIKFGLSPSQNQGFADIKKSARRGSKQMGSREPSKIKVFKERRAHCRQSVVNFLSDLIW